MNDEDLAERVTRLEERAEATSTVRTVLFLVAILAVCLYAQGVLKLDLSAAHG
jgi:hypothetical protein